jgi:hypothetical protein
MITAPRSCAACAAFEAERNPLVLTASGLVHVSHVLDPDDGLYGTAFAERRPLAEIAEGALLADCGYGGCWVESGEPCNAEGIHYARFGRAERKGLITAADMAVVTAEAGPGALPGTVIPAGVLTGAAS